MNILERNNVIVKGNDKAKTTLLFAHGFGCDQNMWRYVAPAFEDHFRVVLFDHVGAGGSDLTAFDRKTYAPLDGYALDGRQHRIRVGDWIPHERPLFGCRCRCQLGQC